MSEAIRSPGSAARWTYRLVMLGALALMLRLNWPGHLSVDSVLALHEGRFHLRETWNPAIFGWLLGQADAVVEGTGLAVAISGALLFAAWAVLAQLRPVTSWLAPIVALAAVALPQVMIYPGIVWKDVWFAECSIAGFVALALALRSGVAAPRWAWLLVSALLFAVAGLLRQNGLILAAPAAIAIAWAGWPRGRVRSAGGAVAWLVLVAAATFALSVYAQPQGVDEPDDAGARGVRIVQTYDIAAAVTRTPLPLSHIDRFDPTLDDFIRSEAPKVFSPTRVDTLDDDSALNDRMLQVPSDVLRAEWFDLMRQHPGLYLKVRAEDFRQVFATPEIDRCLPIYVGIDGPAPAMHDLKLKTRRAVNDGRLYNYSTWYMDTPALSHITYAAIALIVGLVLLWRRDPADLAMAAFMAGALGFAASFFVISIACDYRYLYLLDMAAITGVLYLALDPRISRPPERRQARH
ncbi:hypothetical protein [Phenylobacterium sp.]|uniref:hypothetical protein n=1 Tax=Phenylobacterium sp. TaxID=1871053 RepID=UPI0025E03251|nr:hypothetical protein [Phenylobacterium sp.]